MNQKNIIKRRDLIAVFFRSFLIQAVWNFKSLVSVGMCFALVPVARRLCDKKKVCTKFLKRHLYFFNSHPFFASYALGAITRLEEDRVKGIIKDETQIENFKNALIGPLGAIGDQYFWASIKPGAILVGLTGVTLFSDFYWQLFFLAISLVLYNVPHFYIRAFGLWEGYHKGYAIVKDLKIEKFRTVSKSYLFIGSLMLGIFSGLKGAGFATQNISAIVVFFISAGIVILLRRFNVSFYFSITLVIIMALIIGII